MNPPRRQASAKHPDLISEIRAGLERSFSLVLILFLAPFFTCLVALYRLVLNQPAIIVRKCIGRSGKEFRLYKLNTLKSLHPNAGFFRWMRILGLDELPQLLNIAKGEMAFIGPRPESEAQYMEHPHDSYRRLRLRPGMIGLWQASSGRGGSLRRSWKLDRFYEARKSPAFDVFVVARTLKRIFLDCRKNLRIGTRDQIAYIHHLEATEGGSLKAVQYLIKFRTERVAFLLFQRGSRSIGQEYGTFDSVNIIPCSRFLLLRAIQCFIHTILHFDSSRPMHVHAHSTISGIICRALRPFFGFGLRYTPHCYAFTYPHRVPGMRLTIKVTEWMLARTPFVGVHVSHHEESLHRKLHCRALTTVIPLPADECHMPITPSVGFASRLILVVGSERVQKGYDLLCGIQELLDRGETGFQISVLGEGERDGKVRFYGWQRDVHPFYKNSFCLLNVSHSEGSSLAVIDALNCGLPVVALDIPANRELVLGRGILIPKRSPDAFFLAITELSANWEMYANLHRQGQVFARTRHSLEGFRVNYNRLYLEAGLLPGINGEPGLNPGTSCFQFNAISKPPDWSAVSRSS